MTRFNDSKRRATARGVNRDVCMPHGRGTQRRTCVIALTAALGASLFGTANAAQYQSAAQYQQAQQRQAALVQQAQQRQTAQQAQGRAQQQQSNQSRTPILSGLFGQNNQSAGNAQRTQQQQAQAQALAQQQRQRQQTRESQSQEPQRLGVFGTRPLLSSLKGQESHQNPEQQRQNQEFHAHAQHLNAPNQGAYAANQGRASGSNYARGAEYAQSPAMSAGALTQASTNPAEANEALAKIPWDLFPEQTRARFQQVASSPTMYRRLPMAGGRCNPELFDFFLTYPNTIVELWKQMGYDEVDMKQAGPSTYVVSEKGGSGGKLTILYQSADLAVAHVSGVYRGAGLIRPVEGEAFLVLQTRYTEDPEMTPLVICRLDAFVNIKNPGVDLMARTFNSMIGKVADTNFEQTLAFIDSVSQTAEQDPRQFQSVVSQLYGLSPEARRVLATKAFNVAQQAQQREHGQVVNYELLAKANDPNPGYARILSRGNNQSLPKGGAYAVNKPNSSFQGYASSSELGDEFFESEDASFAESGFSSSGTTRDLNFELSDDFSLASDEGEYTLELDEDESMMTGEEYLATHSLSALKSKDDPNSLAKIGAKPSKNSRALELLDEEEEEKAPSMIAAPAQSLSTDDFAISSDNADDEELVIDSFELPDEDEAPVAIPLSTAPQSSRLPALPSLNKPGARPGAMNAAPLASDDEDDAQEDEEVAEISLDEDGNPVLDFTFDDEASDDDASADPAALQPSLDDDENAIALPETGDDDAADDGEELTLGNDGFTPHVAENEAPYAQEAQASEEGADDSFNDGGWTRSALANPNVVKTNKRVVKKISSDEEPLPERPKPVTRRYAPPLAKSNAATSVKTIDEAAKDKSAANAQDGERVATYRWTPVPGAFVAKTAAVDLNENTLSPKTPKFSKPEVR